MLLSCAIAFRPMCSVYKILQVPSGMSFDQTKVFKAFSQSDHSGSAPQHCWQNHLLETLSIITEDRQVFASAHIRLTYLQHEFLFPAHCSFALPCACCMPVAWSASPRPCLLWDRCTFLSCPCRREATLTCNSGCGTGF